MSIACPKCNEIVDALPIHTCRLPKMTQVKARSLILGELSWLTGTAKDRVRDILNQLVTDNSN